MATIMRSLIAYINEQRVGQLTENAGIWSFAYSDAWLSTGSAYALSPYIPLKSEPQSDSSTQRQLLQQRPDLNRFLGGEMRCVRGIFYSIITDMVQQISRNTS